MNDDEQLICPECDNHTFTTTTRDHSFLILVCAKCGDETYEVFKTDIITWEGKKQ